MTLDEFVNTVLKYQQDYNDEAKLLPKLDHKHNFSSSEWGAIIERWEQINKRWEQISARKDNN